MVFKAWHKEALGVVSRVCILQDLMPRSSIQRLLGREGRRREEPDSWLCIKFSDSSAVSEGGCLCSSRKSTGKTPQRPDRVGPLPWRERGKFAEEVAEDPPSQQHSTPPRHTPQEGSPARFGASAASRHWTSSQATVWGFGQELGVDPWSGSRIPPGPWTLWGRVGPGAHTPSAGQLLLSLLSRCAEETMHNVSPS